MPNYTVEGKILTPMTDSEFAEGMEKGKFVEPEHRAFCVLLFYTGVRKTEGLRAIKEQFKIKGLSIFFSVGKRLKHGIETPPLKLPLHAPYMNELLQAILNTHEGKRVFPYSKATGYNIVRRAFKYPHFFRLSRITNFFSEGYTVADVKSWTGLTLKSLDAYLGIVQVERMGDSLAKPKHAF